MAIISDSSCVSIACGLYIDWAYCIEHDVALQGFLLCVASVSWCYTLMWICLLTSACGLLSCFHAGAFLFDRAHVWQRVEAKMLNRGNHILFILWREIAWTSLKYKLKRLEEVLIYTTVLGDEHDMKQLCPISSKFSYLI